MLTHCQFELDVAKTNTRFNLVAASYYTQGDKDKSDIAGLTAACGQKKNHIKSVLFFFSTHAHAHTHILKHSACVNEEDRV